MKINITNPKDCCGCTSCENVCTHNAITMTSDKLGFLYPHIDINKCVDCGLCKTICQFKKNYNRWDNYVTPNVFAARNKNLDALSKSQSGAAFKTFSDYCLQQGYILYGAILDNQLHVKHYRATTQEGRDKMLYSKYVQSDMRGILKKIKDDVRNGENVLFTGTPCQVSGLKAIIGRQYQQNLLTIDLICHGVPSPAIWESYTEWIKKKFDSQIEEARFRDKRFGWNTHFETFKLTNGKFLKRTTFRDLFYKHLSVRECCSNCHFTNLKRVGDISIGDYWGWFNISNMFNDNKGVSLILINSEKGKALLDRCASQLDIVESNTTDCLQPQLIAPIKLNPLYGQFVQDFSMYGFEFVGKKYGDLSLRYKIIQYKSFIKRLLKKILHFK